MISHLGRYEIIDELGQGAMGIVYKAKDPLIDRTLAIKTISLNLALDEKDEYEARFYQEAKAAGRLSHPNIVTVYDVGKSGDVAYIAMEFLEGRELRDVLKDNKRLPVSQVLDIIIQVASGLDYAHEHGIVHRDVKPSNIMVMREGVVKITDFGIARMASATVQTQVGVVLGTPKYMSPEQVLGKTIDHRADIFSLGVMLYEMLAGQAPFIGDTISAVMYQTMNTVPPPPSALNPDVPDMLNFIVAKALAKGVDERYQNAKKLADDLRACRDALPRSGTKGVAPATNAPTLSATSAAKQTVADVEKTNPAVNRGLSNNFDSFGATMRLAAMTAPEDAEEVAKTLKLTRPQDAIKQAAPQTDKPKVAAATAKRPDSSQSGSGKKVAPGSGNNTKLLVIFIVMLMLLGIAIIF